MSTRTHRIFLGPIPVSRRMARGRCGAITVALQRRHLPVRMALVAR